ncbi:MAG: amidohydrolase family protein [Candidatus Binatia bacterium]
MTTPNGVSVTGAIDADGHILEPPDLWEKYLEPQYRDRAIRIRTGNDGLEYFEFDGKPSQLGIPGFPGLLGAMGEADLTPSPERTYLRSSPPAAMETKARVLRLDQEGLSKAILYPSIGLLWEAEVQDAELSAAYCRAYNRWIVDFCSESGGRLVPIAHLSLGDPTEAARELERSVRAGAKGAFIAPFTWTGRAPGHPHHDPLWAAAQDLDVPVGIHPTAEPIAFSIHHRFGEELQPSGVALNWYFFVFAAHAIQHAFGSCFHYGLFERFPQLKLIVLEAQGGWIGYLLDRMDAVYKGPLGKTTQLKDLPSNHFRRQCWISADPDERALPWIIEHVGTDRFFWASDYPHADHTGGYMEDLRGLVAPLAETAQRQILWENVSRVYKLGQ